MEKNAQDKHSLKMARTPGQMTLPQQISMAASPMAAIRDGAVGSGAAGSGDGKPSGSGAAGNGHGRDAKESTNGRSRSRSRSRTHSPFSAEVLQALAQQLGNCNLDPAAHPPTAEPPAPGASAVQPPLPPPAVQPPLPPPSQPPSPRAAEAESVAAEQTASGSGTATSGGITGPTPASGNARESTPASGVPRELCSECRKFVPSSCSEKPEFDICNCPRCPMCWDRISKDNGDDVETLDCMHVSWLGHNASTQ